MLHIITFPSAISRYLVSDVRDANREELLAGVGFHPLYRGTWYLTQSGKRTKNRPESSFHPLYRGTWYLTAALKAPLLVAIVAFPSAISRYLVSDVFSQRDVYHYEWGFHPLYRGTWYLTQLPQHQRYRITLVSIRYIAVLGI